MPAKWAVAGGRIDRRRMNFFRRWNSKADGRRQVGLAAGNHRSQPADRREQKSSAAAELFWEDGHPRLESDRSTLLRSTSKVSRMSRRAAIFALVYARTSSN